MTSAPKRLGRPPPFTQSAAIGLWFRTTPERQIRRGLDLAAACQPFGPRDSPPPRLPRAAAARRCCRHPGVRVPARPPPQNVAVLAHDDPCPEYQYWYGSDYGHRRVGLIAAVTIFDVAVYSKLQLKPGQGVVIEGLPAGVDLELDQAQLQSDAATAEAVILFVATAAELRQLADDVVRAARRDALAWVAYPKAGQLGTDLNRDSLARLMIERGVQPVRQVAIDEVWSALRFRPGA